MSKGWSGLQLSVILAVLAIGIGGCGSPQARLKNELLTLKQQRGALSDALYREYGGSSISKATEQAATKEAGQKNSVGTLMDLAAGAVREGDRALFDQYVQLAGNGQHVPALESKTRQFFDRQDVKEKAERIARLDLQIADIESKLAALERNR